VLVVLASACAHTGPPAVEEPIASLWSAWPERVLVAGDRVWMAFDGDSGALALGASWSPSGLDEHGPRLRTAWLAPMAPRREGRRWREAVVLGPEEWHRFAVEAGERFVSAVPGEATRLLLGGTTSLLARGADGRVHGLPAGSDGGRATVTREVTQARFLAEALAVLGAEYTTGRGPRSAPRLFRVQDGDRAGGFVLLDPASQLCVVLPHPAGYAVERGGTGVGRAAETLSVLTVESHGLALLKNPFSAVGRLVNSVAQILAGVGESGVASGGGAPVPVATAGSMDLVAWERELDELTGTGRNRGAIRLLVDGDRYFPLLERRIREATTSIEIRVNIFDTDDVAVGVADLLRERSDEVEVRVLVDRLNTMMGGRALPSSPMPEGFRMPASIRKYLRTDSRVKVRSFLNPWGTSDHTKVLLFDRRFAHLGGMNIGREYRYEWHDLMVELEGPVVGALGRGMDHAWAHAGALGDLAFLVATLRSDERFEGEPERPDHVDLRLLHTRTGDPQILVAETAAMRRARREIWLQNPYLYDNAVVDELVKARRRGVDVRVILPADSDLSLGDLSNMVTANLLLENGVRVFVYPGMTHVKALIVDGWACLGSANFNALSLRRNLETNVATSDPGFVGVLRRELFEADLEACHELERPVDPGGGARLASWLMNQL